MAKPVPRTFEERLKDLSRSVTQMQRHSHPGVVTQPAVIDGSVSDPATLAALLAALDAAGIIIDETT